MYVDTCLCVYEYVYVNTIHTHTYALYTNIYALHIYPLLCTQSSQKDVIDHI